MKSWNYEPAKDLELPPVARARSLKRESGIWSTCGHLAWHSSGQGLRGGLPPAQQWRDRRTCRRRPPFVLIANHTSHLDSIVLGSVISCKWCDRVFPVAAGDVFFESPVRSLFSAQLINALPMWRKHCGPHALAELRDRLLNEPCGYILFPEGGRSREGTLLHVQGRPGNDRRRHLRAGRPVLHHRSRRGHASGHRACLVPASCD